MGDSLGAGAVSTPRAAMASGSGDLDLACAVDHDVAGAALALYARLLSASTLNAAAHALVTSLASDFALGRVALALRHGPLTKLLASSTPLGDDALAERLLGAMDEAMDQGLVLALPAVDVGGDGRSAPLRVELSLLQRPLGGAVAVLPLGRDGQVLGAVSVERPAGPPFEPATLARLGQVLALAAPALAWMQQAELPWHRRAARQLLGALDALRRPERRTRQRLLAATAVALAFGALLPLPHAVGGRARIEGGEQRVLSAPTDGFVHAAHVRPGDRVVAGQPLVDLLEDDLRLERDRWASQRAQHENAYAAAMAKADRFGAATAMARVVEAQSQLSLVDERLGRGRIVAPFDAMVIDGDLSQAAGAPVRQGDKLLTLATLGRQRVIVDVDEVDIGAVVPGQAGRLTLSALGWRGEDIVVERIAPMARAVDGRNVFEVEARLVAPGAGLRPGLLGRAEIGVDRRPLLLAWFGRAFDRVRLAWWAWIG